LPRRPGLIDGNWLYGTERARNHADVARGRSGAFGLRA
jgi:hypothetical protein